MTAQQELLNHPYWKATDPAKQKLVRLSAPLPAVLNPFADDGVIIQVAGIPGEIENSKAYVGREGILQGIRDGRITRDTTVVEATSGNTGRAMAKACSALGINFQAIVNADVPQDKINMLRVFAPHVDIILHSSSTETTVERARRLGAEPGFYNPDQYQSMWNPESHKKYLCRQLFTLEPYPSLIAVPGGTMGTSMGIKMLVKKHGLRTKILAVLCKDGQEVPGARTDQKIRRDVLLPWQDYFGQEDIEIGPRHASFYLSWRSWAHLPQMLGPSFGLAFYGALRHVWKHKQAGTLETLRNEHKEIRVIVFGPDDCQLYTPLYFSELTTEEQNTREPLNLDELFARSESTS